jgi:hypothetical protein
LAASTTTLPIFLRIFSPNAGDGASLDQLLMPALNRALALAQMDDVAVVIADDLELDVARVLQVLLDIHIAVAECGFRLALRGLERIGHLARVANHPHASSAAAGDRLHDHRIADVLGDFERLLFAGDRAVTSREHRHTGLAHRLLWRAPCRRAA